MACPQHAYSAVPIQPKQPGDILDTNRPTLTNLIQAMIREVLFKPSTVPEILQARASTPVSLSRPPCRRSPVQRAARGRSLSRIFRTRSVVVIVGS
jgi:hypothetical protein